MKSGLISVLGGTDDATKAAVVPESAPVLRNGAVAALALSGETGLACVIIDPQAGKVAVIDDAHAAAAVAAIIAATGKDLAQQLEATQVSGKGMTWLPNGVTRNDAALSDEDIDIPELRTITIGEQPIYSLSSAISLVEDTLVNVDEPVPCVIVVSQGSHNMNVVTFDTDGHAAAAYAAGKGVSGAVLQAEYLNTPQTTGGPTPQFFE